jgi:uncharacterized protein
MNFARKKVVLDTNTLISAAMNPASISGLVYRYAIEFCTLYRSSDTLNELTVVLNRPFMDRYFVSDAPQARRLFVAQYEEVSNSVSVNKVATECTDPKDNMFLSLAWEIEANYLVSGNTKHLNVMGHFKTTAILTNRAFLTKYAPSRLPN